MAASSRALTATLETGQQPMGSWGAGIFQDDFACDVESAYRDLLALGMEDDESTSQLEKQFNLDSVYGSHDYSTFWIALALSQHKFGRLEDRVKQRALEEISSGKALQLWSELVDHERASIKKRQSALLKAKEKILSKCAKRRSLKPSRELTARINQTFDPYPWKRGNVYSYRLPSDEYVLLACAVTIEERYTGYYKSVGKKYVRDDPPPLLRPFLLLLDYRGTRAPTIEDVTRARVLLANISEHTKYEFLEYARNQVEFANKLLSEDYVQFRDKVSRAEPKAKEDELQERYVLRQKSAEITLEKYSSANLALEIRSYKLYVMNPKLPIPRERLRDLGVSREFLCDYWYYATDWGQLELSIARWHEEERPLGELGFGIDPLARK